MVYALAGVVCVTLSAAVANVSWMLYIPAGLSMTAALMWGSRVWPAVFAGELAMCIITGQSIATGSVMSVGNGLDAALTGWWFHDRLGRRIELDRIREVVQLIGAQLSVFQPLCTVFGMAALVLTGNMPAHRLASTAAAWYSANLYAQFLTGPTALAWLRWPRPAARRSEYLELALLLLLTLVVGAIGPGRWAIRPLPLPVTLILVFPLLAWASMRFLPSVALTVGAVLGLFAFDAALAGVGPFQGTSLEDRMVALNVFMSVSIGTGLSWLRRPGKRATLRGRAGATHRKATVCGRTGYLGWRSLATFCSWSGRVRWKDEWVSVETFLSERYNLNISHGISDESMKIILADAGVPLPERLLRGNPASSPD